MGGAGSKCCGGGAAVPKDKNDKYIDEIEYESLGVPSIDEALEPAFEMLGTAIAVNNAIVKTMETVKIVGAALMGAMSTDIDIKESTVKFIMVKEDDSGEKIPVAEVIGGTGAETTQIKSAEDYKKVTDAAETLSAVEACSAQLAKLNDALKEASMVGVKSVPGGRLGYVAGDVPKDDANAKKQLAEVKTAITGFNNTFFTVKYQLVAMNLKGGLGEAISEMIANIKKLVADIKPTLEVDLAKIAEGELAITPSLGVDIEKIANTCPKKVKKCLDAVFGEGFLTSGDPMSAGGLLAVLVETAKKCAELMTKFNESKDAITALASNPSDIITKSKEAGLDQMAAMKIPGKVAANVKTVTKTPLILADLFNTIKTTATEIKDGMTK